MVRKRITAFSLVFLLLSGGLFGRTYVEDNNESNYENQAISIYKSLSDTSLTFEAFYHGYRGHQKLLSQDLIRKKNILTIIDFSRSSGKNRFFIIDLENRKILYSSLVAHGLNSGWDLPVSFSNIVNSKKSSLGFFLTGETYTGKHGLSLKLDGLEEGINDNARKRYIVIHSANYVSPDFVAKIGRLGRSYGCPALPRGGYKEIIDTIKGKSLLFIYSHQKEYFNKSRIL